MTAWTARVLHGLPSPVLDALVDVPGVWVVGGAVRDVLLGRRPRELDLLVEGDPADVAARLGTPTAVHERFGTLKVAGADVARTRKELYARPGALPEVALGASVPEDLSRRDFTVNALAVRLADGEGADWPGALEDLEAGVLRILHPHSFEDDPTRLLRLVRYAARLGFGVEAETDRLAAAAVAGGALETVSGSRLGAELRLALREPLPGALVALERHDLGARAVHPAFAADARLLDAVLAEVPPGAMPGLAALGACLLDAGDVPAALDRLAFPAAERAIVTAAAAARPLAAALAAASAPSQVAAAARRQPAEALAVAAALGATECVRRWLSEWRHVRSAVTGEDLLEAGLRGPDVGKGLQAALAAALDGRAADRDGQLQAALRAVE